MNPKFRWLLHSAVEENFPHLFTFSVGEENLEQVVVCRVESILRKIRSGDCTHEKALSWAEKKYGIRKPQLTDQRRESDSSWGSKRLAMKKCQETQRESPKRSREALRTGAQSETRKPSRHPDIQLYVPRARRSGPTSAGQAPGDTPANSLGSVPAKPLTKQVVTKRGPVRDNNTTKSELPRRETSRATTEAVVDPVKNQATCDGSSSMTDQVGKDVLDKKLNFDKSPSELGGELLPDSNENNSVPVNDTKEPETSCHPVEVCCDDQNHSDDSCNFQEKKLTLGNERTSEQCAIPKEMVRESDSVKPCDRITDDVPNDDDQCSSKKIETGTVNGSSAEGRSSPLLIPNPNPTSPKAETSVPAHCSSSSPTVSSRCTTKIEGQSETVKNEDRSENGSRPPLVPGDSGVDSWDALFDENGDCLHPSVMEGLKSALGKVDIRKPKIDYLVFHPPEPDLSDECYDHILELYDFPVDFKTQNLMMAFSAFKDRGFDIKWVDDTHALAIFSSPVAASEALELQIPFIKTRPVSQAISKSKNIVSKKLDCLLPSRPRPETSALLARRMITGALGVRSHISREQRDLERRKLQAAKEIKRQVAKQKQDIWNGTVS